MFKNKYIELIVLLFSFTFIWTFFLFGFEGYYGWDDMEYARLAYEWAIGNFDLSNNHFSYRHPIVFLTGLSYRIFGLNDFASALPAIFITKLILLLIYIVLFKNDTRIIITALIITLFMPFFILYSHKLMGDMYVAVCIFGAFTSLYLYKFRYKKYSLFLGLLFSLFLFVAFLSKEVVVLILPVLLIIFLTDLFKKQSIYFWLWSLAFGTILMFAYHLLIWQITGSPWSRYEAILENAYVNPCQYEMFPLIYTLKRILYEFWNELILSGLFVVFIFVLPSFLRKTKFSWFNKSESHWISIAIFALLSANFMTKSYNSYSPMCLDMRHYLYLIPIVSVAAAPNIVRFFYTANRNWIVLISILIIACIFIIQINKLEQEAFFYSVVFIFLIAIVRIIKPSWTIKGSTILWITFLFAWLIFPIHQMVKLSNNNPFIHIKPFIEKHFKTNTTTFVLTNPIMKRIADYYIKWDSSKVRFINDRSPVIPYFKEANNYLVYKNGITWWYLEKKHPEPMLLWYLLEPNIQLIDSNKGNYLYKIVNPEKIFRPTHTLNYFNDMEIPVSNYSVTSHLLDTNIKFSGKYSCKLSSLDFSPTLSIPFSSFVGHKTNKFEVEIAAKVFYPQINNTNMVVSVVDSLDRTIFWLGKSLKELIKPSENWQHVSFTASYMPNKNTNLILKTYLWNNDQNTIWIDNLSVKITVIEHL